MGGGEAERAGFKVGEMTTWPTNRSSLVGVKNNDAEEGDLREDVPEWRGWGLSQQRVGYIPDRGLPEPLVCMQFCPCVVGGGLARKGVSGSVQWTLAPGQSLAASVWPPP